MSNNGVKKDTKYRAPRSLTYPGSSSMVTLRAVEDFGMEAGAKAAAEPARARTVAAKNFIVVVFVVLVCC